MIVDTNSKSLRVVTQVEHAKLSWIMIDDLMKKRPKSSVGKAVKHHDDGWSEWDSKPRLSDGVPVDYRSMQLSDHLKILKKSIDRCEELDPYSGWLVSKHGCSFHESKTDDQAEKFLSSERQRRRKLSDTTSFPDKKTRSRDFDVLQFLDAVSLFLISPWSPEWSWNRSAPYNISIEHKEENEFHYHANVNLPNSMKFTYNCKMVPQSSYSNSEEFKNKLESVSPDESEVILKNS